MVKKIIKYFRDKRKKKNDDRIEKMFQRINNYAKADQNIYSRLDDICIKHHGQLPYEDF